IDWMALNGINMPLAITGQEAIWQKVWTKEFGLTDEEVRSFFTGPAHLPWHRMSNIDRWQGPLPQSWLDHQLALQKRILARERELGMTPVLPAFNGHVPEVLKEKYPEAKIEKLKPWAETDEAHRVHLLYPMDPLFRKIQKAFMEEQSRQFGTDHIYGVDPLNEVHPPSWEPEYLVRLSKTIYESMAETDPEAKWLQMGWMFLHARKDWTSERIEAVVNAVPPGKMILLDYFCENTEVWPMTDSFFGQPFIWSHLGNFGGNTIMCGEIGKSAKRFENTLSTNDNLVGIGSTLEALDVNPPVYEHLFERAWDTQEADLETWFNRYADRRCGTKDENARAAWKLLKETIYTDVPTLANVTLTNIRPLLKGYDEVPYSNTDLFRAWELLLQAKDLSRDAAQYDVVNVGRQVLGNHYTALRNRFTAAYEAKDTGLLKSTGAKMNELMADLDRLLATRSSFLLGKWIEEARAFGINEAEADYYENNARTLITTWEKGGHILADYADRNLNGLTETFYAPRWTMFIDDVIAAAEAGQAFDAKAFKTKSVALESEWTKQRQKFPACPTGDAVAIAKQLMEKYKNEIREPSIVPKPVHAEVKRGSFTINAETKIAARPDNAEARRIAGFLANALQLETIDDAAASNVIILEIAEGLEPEGYTLSVGKEQILVRGKGAGLFYGMQTLLQMLPADRIAALRIPAVEIADEPRFKWRGMHLDVSRHFFEIDFIKKYIDLLAMHKLNTFHWHLVDDQGWRIEIKAYPLLSEKAAWREGTGTEAWDYFVGPAVEGKPKYGGF
ncbi:MAG: alpha-N-acetylglucosaminidase TIM-barrel domain-containing protein, partial [Verrucomicrobiota bacterium]